MDSIDNVILCLLTVGTCIRSKLFDCRLIARYCHLIFQVALPVRSSIRQFHSSYSLGSKIVSFGESFSFALFVIICSSSDYCILQIYGLSNTPYIHKNCVLGTVQIVTVQILRNSTNCDCPDILSPTLFL